MNTTSSILAIVRRRLFIGVPSLNEAIGRKTFKPNAIPPLCLGGIFFPDNKAIGFYHFSRRELSSTTKEAAEASPSSSSNRVGTYAVVDHSEAYEMAMEGRHGQTLSLALLEGIGKDDLPFDPFSEDEAIVLEEDRQGKISGKSEEEEECDEEKSKTEYEDEDFLDEEEESTMYNRDGSIRRKKSVLATLRAGYPSGGLFVVVALGGSQYKVTTDDLLVVNRLKPVDHFKIGSVHTLKDILLVGSSHITMVGMPYVNGAEVDVMVEEITQDAKVIIFKKRRRKHSQRKNGYRRDLTLLRVLDIRLPQEYQGHKHVGRDSVDYLDSSTDNGVSTKNDGAC